jgi:hypothetical protein
MKEALQSLFDLFHGAKHTWPKAPKTAQEQDQVWYAGSAVCPVEFSQQLVSLQLSLQGETPPARIPTKSAASVESNAQAA